MFLIGNERVNPFCSFAHKTFFFFWRQFLQANIKKKKKNEEPARPPLQPHDPVKRAGQAQGQASDIGRSALVRLTGM